jgi:hypothetical protein
MYYIKRRPLTAVAAWATESYSAAAKHCRFSCYKETDEVATIQDVHSLTPRDVTRMSKCNVPRGLIQATLVDLNVELGIACSTDRYQTKIQTRYFSGTC